MTFQDSNNVQPGYNINKKYSNMAYLWKNKIISIFIETNLKCRYFTVVLLRAYAHFAITQIVY